MNKIQMLATGAAVLCAFTAFADYVPSGEPVNYTKEAAGTAVLNGMLIPYMDDFPATIIWGSNNKVFFKNLISTYPDDYYIQGKLEGDIITVPAGQVIEYNQEFDESICFGVFRTVPRFEGGEEYIDFVYAPEIESVTFKVAEDGGITMVLPGDPFDGENPTEYVAGTYYSDDYSYAGYGDFFQSYTRLELEQIAIPEGAEIKQYAYIDPFDYASIVDVAFYGDYLYIRGLSSMLPEGTIRAKINGNRAVVEQNEYLGVYFNQYYIFTKVLYSNPDYDEEDPATGDPFIFAPEDVGFELYIDPETGTISADKEGVYLSFHCDADDFLNSLGFFDVFQLKYQDSFEGTPANPTALEFHTEWASQQGWNDFFFTLSNYSTSGTLLDTEKLYYKVFVNGTPLVFYQHEATNLLGKSSTIYPGVPIRVELMPYAFNNNEDIFKFNENAFDVGIYTDDVETIGVQSVYVYNNVYTFSEIVTLDVATGEITTTDAVKSLDADSDVVSSEYYSLDGRRVINPDHGIYIRVDRMSNGSAISSKIVK